MKKIYTASMAGILLAAIFCAYSQSVCREFIRFRVIAESNSPYDQLIKTNLKNKILPMLYEGIKKSKTKEEAKEYLKSNSETVKSEAESFLKENGCESTVTVRLINRYYSKKKCSDFIAPAGKYDCFEIKIGEGKGKNYFCVMFPSAFVCGEMTDGAADKSNSEKIIYKFKITELFKRGD